MAKAKYADLVQPMRLWTELVRPSMRGKLADFSLIHDEKVQPKTQCWIEVFYAYAGGQGAGGLPGDLQPYWKGKPLGKGPVTEGGMHAHPTFDELFIFIGSDPADNTRLGGEVEFWIGDGKDAEKYVFTEPTACWCPKNIAHNPWVITKVNDPKHPVMCVVLAMTPKYSEPGDANDKSTVPYPLPKDFSMDMTGKPQTGKGKFAKYINRLLLSQTILIPELRGRVCVPNLMFDNYVQQAPVWIEFFLVYAGGQGVGVPTLEYHAPRNGKQMDWTKGMQHSQNFDELFMFVGTDPHDTLNLGGEIVTYLGDEAYSITKSSTVWVPASAPPRPGYWRDHDPGRSSDCGVPQTAQGAD